MITVQNYLSDGTAAAGQFVWNGTATVNPVSGGAIGVGKVATGNGTGGGALAGLAVRLITGVLPDTSDGQLTYERGELVTVAIRGDFFVTATGSATAGQSVNVVTATGAMTYGTPGTGEVATSVRYRLKRLNHIMQEARNAVLASLYSVVLYLSANRSSDSLISLKNSSEGSTKSGS